MTAEKKPKPRIKSSNKIKTVSVLGATGYVGARLVPELVEHGYKVRACGRSVDKLRKRPWCDDPKVELVEFDVFDTESLTAACQGSEAAYYLIHSMNPDGREFEKADRQAAENMVKASEDAGLRRIVYLGGLGEKNETLSKHLLSRIEVGEILLSGKVPTTVLRAAMIIGAGSASFEILRYLVERLHVMITPKWVRIVSQPIAIRDVLDYLVDCLDNPEMENDIFDIGGPEVLSYQSLMELYAEEAGLNKRLVMPVPVLTPKLSSYWIHLVTPINSSIARPLAEGLSSKVVCNDQRILNLIPLEPTDCRTAIRAALDQSQHNLLRDVDEEDDNSVPPPEWSYPGDDSWAGGKVFEDHRKVLIQAEPQDIWKELVSIGGENGWYYADWLWQLRGLIDKLLGGVGMRQGRTDPKHLNKGDIVDFWRIIKVKPERRLLLEAEMKVPGSAILDFSIIEKGDSLCELHQVARFIPKGMSGMLYWYAVTPLHELIFSGMLSRIAAKVEKPIISGPDFVKHHSS